ncbi:MAG: hypothetical protein PHW96_02735 [Candidatus Nanoarchaeia archaeon]|nr:hypothetical protein [Candidatus Nanoarchaeia archaeon]
MQDFWFWTHTISSIVAFVLVIILDLQCIVGGVLRKISLRKKSKKEKKQMQKEAVMTIRYHKEFAIAMLFALIVSLISSLFYGFTITFDFTDIFNLHYWFGFGAFVFALLPFPIIYILKRSPLHYPVAYISGIFMILAVITGFMAYGPMMKSYFPDSGLPIETGELECMTLEQINSTERCLVAVDSVVYDMTNMPRWGSGKHYDYFCGGNYTKEYILSIVPSHAADKYYGAVAGTLCEE